MFTATGRVLFALNTPKCIFGRSSAPEPVPNPDGEAYNTVLPPLAGGGKGRERGVKDGRQRKGNRKPT